MHKSSKSNHKISPKLKVTTTSTLPKKRCNRINTIIKRFNSTTPASTTTSVDSTNGSSINNNTESTSETKNLIKPPKFNLIRAQKIPLSTRPITNARKRVVVTGIGIVSPLGNDVDDVYTKLLSGYSAICPIDSPELLKLSLQAKSYAPVGIVPELDDPNIIPRHLKQVLSRHQVYALVAAHRAMLSANLLKPKNDNENNNNINDNSNSTNQPTTTTTTPSESQSDSTTTSTTSTSSICNLGHDTLCDLCEGETQCAYQRDESDRLGVCIGNSIGCVEEIGSSHVKIQEKGGKGAGAYSLPKLLVNLAAGHITQIYQARALTHTVSTACATGAHAIGDALNFIRNDQADIIIAGGTETGVSPLSLSLFNRIHALSRQNASMSGGPFTTNRDGFVMGEGAAILILESLDSALKRNANILCEVLGYGISSDAYHITQPHKLGRGAFMAMENALHDAHIDMTYVDYINAHATSTPIGDISEASAIRALTQIHYIQQKRNKMKQLQQKRENNGKVTIINNNNKQSTTSIDGTNKILSSPSTSKTTQLNGEKLPIPNQMYSRPLVSSTKGHVGHLLGAAGALEAVFSIMAIQTNQPPPTLLRGSNISPNIPVNVISLPKDLDTTLPKKLIDSTTTTTTTTTTTDTTTTTSPTTLRGIQETMTLWEETYINQSTEGTKNIKPLTDLEDGVDYYTNEQGYIVLTEKYHLDKGYCCENACKHCPYDFNKDKLAELKQHDLLKGELNHSFEIDVVMSNSFGFGGANASLVFGRYNNDSVTI